MSHRFDRRSRPADLDMCNVLPPEEVEQQLAWRSRDAGSGLPSACPYGSSGPFPLKFESCTAQSPSEEPRRLTDVAPEGLVHRMLIRSGTTAVGSTYVLVVDQELVEVRHPAHPSDPEEAWRRPRSDRRNEPRKVPRSERSPSPFSKAAPPAGQNKPRSSQIVVLAQNEVRSEIAGSPPLQESWRLGTELFEQVAEPCPFNSVEEHDGHVCGV